MQKWQIEPNTWISLANWPNIVSSDELVEKTIFPLAKLFSLPTHRFMMGLNRMISTSALRWRKCQAYFSFSSHRAHEEGYGAEREAHPLCGIRSSEWGGDTQRLCPSWQEVFPRRLPT